MRYLTLLSTLILVGRSFCEEVIPESLAGNIRIHLVGARMGARPSGAEHLIAKFRPEDGGREFFCEFPAKPGSGHEATLANVIRSSTSWTERASGNKQPPVHWDSPKLHLVLSMPPLRVGEAMDWSKCVVLSVSSLEGDKKDAEDAAPELPSAAAVPESSLNSNNNPGREAPTDGGGR
jgi:hypothetical protein